MGLTRSACAWLHRILSAHPQACHRSSNNNNNLNSTTSNNNSNNNMWRKRAWFTILRLTRSRRRTFRRDFNVVSLLGVKSTEVTLVHLKEEACFQIPVGRSAMRSLSLTTTCVVEIQKLSDLWILDYGKHLNWHWILIITLNLRLYVYGKYFGEHTNFSST